MSLAWLIDRHYVARVDGLNTHCNSNISKTQYAIHICHSECNVFVRHTIFQRCHTASFLFLLTSPTQHRGPLLYMKLHNLLVFIWSSGPLEFYDASPALRPFSHLQYRVRSHNSKGSVLSQWASALTLQAEPQDMAPPTVTPTGEFAKSRDDWFGSNVLELN